MYGAPAAEPRNTATRREPANELGDAQWWLKKYEDAERARRIVTTAGLIWNELAPLRTMFAACARRYGNSPIVGLGPREYRDRSPSSRTTKLSINIVKSVCDTYVSLVTEDRPKVTFLTSGGDYDLQERAKLLESFVDGIVYDQDLHSADAQMELDVAQFGTAWEFYSCDESDPKSPRLACERALPWEVLIDDFEGQYGKPSNLYRVKEVDLDALIASLEADDTEESRELADKLHEQGSSTSGFDMSRGTASAATKHQTMRTVVLIEAWHLPSSTTSGDGCHAIACGDVLLENEEWARLEFPCEPLYRLRPTTGMWGSALADELAGIQSELNVLSQKIQRTHHLLGAGHWLIEDASMVNTNQMDNQIGSMVRYRGIPPQFFPGGTVPDGVWQERDRLKGYGYELIGISPMSAQAELPAGIRSGRAMRTYAQVQNKRLQPSYRQLQDFYLRRARQILKMARQIGEKYPNWQVKAAGKETAEDVKWADAHLRDEEFVLKLYPTNSLADDPAERIEQVQEIQGLSPAMKRLLDFADLVEESNYEQASYKLTMRCAMEILKKGRYVGPEVYMDLNESIKRMQLVRVRARLDGVAEDKLRLLQDWIDQAIDLRDSPEFQKMNPAPASPPGALPPGAAPGPQGSPMPMAA